MFYRIGEQNKILSPMKKYQTKPNRQSCANSIVEFDIRKIKEEEFKKKLVLSAIEETDKEYERENDRKNHTICTSKRVQNDDGSYTETEKYNNGSKKCVTCYKDGSFDEIYTSKNGLSYTRIKRYTTPDNYTEIYQDSSGFCGKETFIKLDDGTSISTNEFNNGKKYTETYRKNSDGGFTRILENSDGTGYTETQSYKEDGSSTYSIENQDGTSNTIVYNADGSYIEIVTDIEGRTEINRFGAG